MANEKPTNARLQMKHDIEANWIIAGNATNPFVPKPGELIIYDVDDSHDSPRIKIGDGDNNVNELPFFVDETKADKDEILDENGTLKNDVLPTGYPYISQGVIIEETVAIEESGEGLITNEFQLIKDERYIVTWNGVEYNCIAKSYILDGVEIIVLGNIAAFDENEEPTDEPFMIGAFPESAVAEIGGYGAILSLDGSTEVVISIYGNIIKKISKEFLPNIPNINNIVDGSQIGSVRTILTYDIIGYGAHAEGSYTTASGYYSHAEGSKTTASGERSHAEGSETTASGASSHAEGKSTIASGDFSHVQGKYNIEDINNQYAHIIGNGSSDSARSNAHTLDWNGNAWFQGDVYVGGENMTNGSKLVTESTFNEIANNAYDQLQQLKNLSQSAANAALSSSLTWDGNIGDKEFIVSQENDTSKSILVHICDEVPVDFLDNPVFATIIGEDGMIFTYQCQWESWGDIYIGIEETSGLPSLFIWNSDQNLGGDQYAKKGIYFIYQQDFVDDQWKTTGYTVAANFYGNSFAKENIINALGYVPAEAGSIDEIHYLDNSHNIDTSAHQDIRDLIDDLQEELDSYSNFTSTDRENLNKALKKPGEIVTGKEYIINNETVIAKAYAEVFNFNNIASGEASHAEGYATIASGSRSHAEGFCTTASGSSSHAEGESTTASGYRSHAEGLSTSRAFDYITKDSTEEEIISAWNDNNFTLGAGNGSHAEGGDTLALGGYSHAEGNNTIASGYASHTEGYSTTASGNYSHAEGNSTTASGTWSHAEGNSTTASCDYQHVQGKFNVLDTNNKYAHIVGNGTSNRGLSNAHTVDWNGNAWFAGDVYVGSTSGKNKDEGSKKLVTEAELASLIAQITEAVSQKSQVQLITWEADD